MDIHELALKTYNDLQKRKKERKLQHQRDIDSVVIGNVLRVQKAKYRQYWSRGV